MSFKEFRKTEKLMGNRFEITVVADEEEWANNQINLAIDEIRRIEALLSTYRENSQANQINDMAGIAPVKVDTEVYQIIERSIRISGLTDGAFDITYGSIDKNLWNFDQNMTSLPDPVLASAMVGLINYRDIILDPVNTTVMLKRKGMRIGFGGIGKGYAAEMARALLKANGVQSGIVNAAGDLCAWGKQADGKNWKIGITNPDNKNLPFAYLDITNMAVATSGNYEKYAWINGKKYSHTINPKTGMPVTGIKSVTIISPNAEIADAMATPVTIMGIRSGLNLVNQVDLLECIIIDDNNKIYTSNNINLQ